MTDTQIQDIAKDVVRRRPGVMQADVVNGIANLYAVPKAHVRQAVKRCYPIRPTKQSNGRIALFLLKPGSLTDFYK